MKTIVKPLFCSAMLTAIGLSFTISHASEALNFKPVNVKPVSTSQAYKQDIVVLTKLTAYANGKVENKQESFGQLFDKPLVKIPLDEMPIAASNKKNEFFELATIFNDKLQQIIAVIKSFKLFKQAHAMDSTSGVKVVAHNKTCSNSSRS